MLELQNITKIYHPGSATEHRLFEGFSLTVPDGQFVSIVGSNGSGKTSLLNILCGSIGVEGGDVLVDGESIQAGTVSFVNANDGSCEGMEYPGLQCFTVQFHPEACAGPADTSFLFDKFLRMIDKQKEGK